METASIIATHTPVYVWLVLALLLFLGVRRLKPRRTHLALAAPAPLGFLTWSVLAAGLLFFGGDKETSVVAWGVAFLTGALSGPIRTVPSPKHMHGWVFEYSATELPLTLYMLLWATRYGLGIWAGFVPAMADALGLAGLALSALTAGRTLADFIPPLATALRVRKAGIEAI
ncbi:MAG TPA: hypothetical protein VF589_10465 [Allosphingosinicella sp.]|jgi:hypothetical protein